MSEPSLSPEPNMSPNPAKSSVVSLLVNKLTEMPDGVETIRNTMVRTLRDIKTAQDVLEMISAHDRETLNMNSGANRYQVTRHISLHLIETNLRRAQNFIPSLEQDFYV